VEQDLNLGRHGGEEVGTFLDSNERCRDHKNLKRDERVPALTTNEGVSISVVSMPQARNATQEDTRHVRMCQGKGSVMYSGHRTDCNLNRLSDGHYASCASTCSSLISLLKSGWQSGANKSTHFPANHQARVSRMVLMLNTYSPHSVSSVLSSPIGIALALEYLYQGLRLVEARQRVSLYNSLRDAAGCARERGWGDEGEGGWRGGGG
jgi:hypothetical protein